MINAYLIKINKNKRLDLNCLDESILFHCKNNEISLLSYHHLIKILRNDFNINEVKIDFSSKPRLINSSYQFNISHCKNYILIGISDDELGVDIEEKSRVISDNLINRTLSIEEKRLVNNSIDFLI